MNINKKSRRQFITKSLIGAAGLYQLAALTSCSSFDDFFFDDHYQYEHEVVIIGGGLSGLYLASELRRSKTEFRLFEGSTRFGGRVRSFNGSDYGASFFSKNDQLVNALADELLLEKKQIDRQNFYLSGGMQSLTDGLLDLIVGLIPYRNFRLRWSLTEIEKLSDRYSLVFENPAGQKKITAKKIALAIPPTQWPQIKGLMQLPEMSWAEEWLSAMKTENSIKFILPASSFSGSVKPFAELQQEQIRLRQLYKKTKNEATVEVEVRGPAAQLKDPEAIYSLLRKKLPIGNFQFQKLPQEQFFDWGQVRLLQGSRFTNFLAVPPSTNPTFQIVGDFTAVKSIYTMEGALQSAAQAVRWLI